MVAITGLAWATPLGDSVTQTWCELMDGASGLIDMTSPHDLRSLSVGPVPGLNYNGLSPNIRMETLARRGLTTALSDAVLSGSTARSRWHVVLGTSFGASADEDVALAAWATNVCASMDLPAPTVITTACSSGADAIAVASDLIRAGEADVCLCGGVDVLSEAKRLGHSALRTMSPSGLRAFDTTAEGMVLGEGYGIMVLEAEPHARGRGHAPYGKLLGSGSSNDATGLTQPDVSGDKAVRAIESALRDAGVQAEDIVIVSAHATGTPINDALEAAALSRVFDQQAPPLVMATKGALGHSLGATGAVEAIALLQALQTGRVPPIHGLRDVHPDLLLPVPPQDGPIRYPRIGVSLNLGFGGFNSCLVLEGAAC